MFEKLKKIRRIGDFALKRRTISVALLLIFVVLLSAGSGLYAGASYFAQQAPNVTVTTTIFTTTTSWTTSTVWSTIWSTVEGILTTIQYTTSTSTTTVTAQDTYTKLLLHMDGTDGSRTFVDNSLAHTITATGDAQIDTAQSKFGGASGLFDGSGDYLSIPDSADWAFGSGDFTVDFWVRRGSIGTRQLILGQLAANGADASASFIVEFRADNRVAVDFSIGGAFLSFASTVTITDTTGWHHIALVRNGNNLYLYIDGTRDGSYATSASMTDSTSSLSVGRAGDYNGLYFNGWIDELRISKGIARWTSNFTPPAAPY